MLSFSGFSYQRQQERDRKEIKHMKNRLHVKAPGNWVNDPNGMIYYKGQYHLFYQHFPYAPRWGTMHWGHAVSPDLIHWEHVGVALFPSLSEDQNGCFSGSAVEENGVMHLFYTGVHYNGKDILCFGERGRMLLGQTQYKRKDVKTLTFQSSLSGVPSSAWDVSEAGDGSVLAWMDNSNLYVASDGEIAPNSHASWIFQDFVNLKAIDFGNCFVTSNVTDMSNMFSYCSSLTELDLSNFDTSNVTNMRGMFDNCGNLTSLDLSNFDTSNVTDMNSMFYYCQSLTSLDLSGFETPPYVRSIYRMFKGCDKLKNLICSDGKILEEYKNR